MLLRKGQLPILVVNIASLVFFTFLIYGRGWLILASFPGVILLLSAIIFFLNTRIFFPNWLLWCAVFWGALHMAGGGVSVNGVLLYGVLAFPLSDTLPILRFDQMVHFFGFGVATLLLFYISKPVLNFKAKNRLMLYIVIFLAGLGLGAINEIVEAFTLIFLNNNGVGDQLNTFLDFVADILGGIVAVLFIYFKEKKG